MSDLSSVTPSRAAIDQLRDEYLNKVREAFGKAIDIVQSFRDLSAHHPDDLELQSLTALLCGIIRQLLNTVTCKVAANGMAADWERLFEECEHHGEGERSGPTTTE